MRVRVSDWRIPIVELVFVHQQIREADIERLWTHPLPEVAASLAQLKETEVALGIVLDERYKAFLTRANGWKHFLGDIDLFGTKELEGGREKEHAVAIFLSAVEGGGLEGSSIKPADVLVIGGTLLDKDVFLIGKEGTEVAGKVFWFAGELVDEFSDFDDFFLAMIELNKKDLQLLHQRHASERQ